MKAQMGSRASRDSKVMFISALTVESRSRFKDVCFGKLGTFKKEKKKKRILRMGNVSGGTCWSRLAVENHLR